MLEINIMSSSADEDEREEGFIPNKYLNDLEITSHSQPTVFNLRPTDWKARIVGRGLEQSFKYRFSNSLERSQ